MSVGAATLIDRNAVETDLIQVNVPLVERADSSNHPTDGMIVARIRNPSLIEFNQKSMSFPLSLLLRSQKRGLLSQVAD